MFIRIVEWLGDRSPRELAILCLLFTTGTYAGIFCACLGA